MSRPAGRPGEAAAKFSGKYGQSTAVCLFDRVFVPWERVFAAGEWDCASEILYNYTALEQNVARVAGEADVVYALVLDADGRVAAHSRDPERVGAVLEGLVHRRAALASELLVQETVTSQGEAIYDFAVPVQVEGRKWGTIRVGLSKQRMEALIRRTRWELGVLTVATLIVGGLAAAIVARRISRPVQSVAIPGTRRMPARAIPRRARFRAVQPSAKTIRKLTDASSKKSTLSANSDTEPMAIAVVNSTPK